MKLCDSSFLFAFLHPNPNPPKDRQEKPVVKFRERISALIEELSAANDVIGIPTPALAETLVRSGPNRAQYMKILGDSWKFQLIPFDARAAIEAAELVAAVKNNKDPWAQWGKVKFDIQIVATAKAEGVSLIYSDDIDIENYAKRFKIRVMRICDLPYPLSEDVEDRPVDSTPIGGQTQLFPIAAEVKSNGQITATAKSSDESNELQADPTHPAPVQRTNSGRPEGEAPAKTEAH